MKLHALITVAAISAALSGCVGAKGVLPVRLTWGGSEKANSERTNESPPTPSPSRRQPAESAEDPSAGNPSSGEELSDSELDAKLLNQLLGMTEDPELRAQIQQQLASRETPAFQPNSRTHNTRSIAPTDPRSTDPRAADPRSVYPLSVDQPSVAPPAPSSVDSSVIQATYMQDLPQANVSTPESSATPSTPFAPNPQTPTDAVTAAPTISQALPSNPIPSPADSSVDSRSSTDGDAADETDAEAAEETNQEATGDWTRLTQLAHDEMERLLARSADEISPAERSRLEIRMRLMALILGQKENALKTIDSLEPEQQAFWNDELFALLKLTEPEELQFDSTFRFNDQRRIALCVEHLRAAEQALAASASLVVHRVALCDQVNSYGNFHEFTRKSFRPNDQLIVYCEVENFKAEKQDDPQQGQVFESEFKPSIVLFDANRNSVGQYDFDLIVDRSRQIRRDFYLHFVFTIPADLPPGRYFLGVLLEDHKANKSGNAAPIEIEVR